MKGYFLLGLLAAASAAATGRPSVTISDGVVVGVETSAPNSSARVNKYLAIPYANSPPKRFAPPEPPKKWTKALDASKLSNECIPQFNDPPLQRDFFVKVFDNPGAPPLTPSEDCLYLNVFQPQTKSKDLAVMFWIHGGAYQSGSANFALFDGSSLAANEEVIVVATNYRTNVFGFPSAPDLAADQKNLGLLDQRMALQWVQDNIKSFGGDPAKVTVFGQSAGGSMVSQLVANPPQPRGFQAAIIESDGTLLGNGTASWITLAKSLGCATDASGVDCVRAAPAEDIQNTIQKGVLLFPPVEDKVTYVNDFRSALADKRAANVPLLMGTVADEGTAFAVGAGVLENSVTDPALAILPFSLFNPGVAQALAQAYGQKFKTTFEIASVVITDGEFNCRAKLLTESAAAAGFDVWRYRFSAEFPNDQPFPGSGVFHTYEIQEVFGTFEQQGATQQQKDLSVFMQKVWAGFAKDPQKGAPWTQVSANKTGVELGEIGANGSSGEKTIDKQVADQFCDLWTPVFDLVGV